MLCIKYIFLRSLGYYWVLTLLLLVLYLGRWSGLKRDQLKTLDLTAGSTGRLTDGRRTNGRKERLPMDEGLKDRDSLRV